MARILQGSEFDNFQKSLTGNSADTPDAAYEKYQKARSKVNSSMCAIEHENWKMLVQYFFTNNIFQY